MSILSIGYAKDRNERTFTPGLMICKEKRDTPPHLKEPG